MKTLQIYFSPTRDREDQHSVFARGVDPIGYVRTVLISDCDVSHAIARAKPRQGEVFVGAVALE